MRGSRQRGAARSGTVGLLPRINDGNQSSDRPQKQAGSPFIHSMGRRSLAAAAMHTNDTAPESVTIEALQAITDAMHRMAMKLIVLDMAFQDAIATMPTDQRKQFSASFKARATSVMHDHSNTLMPIDDSEISLAVARILKASSPTDAA